MPESHLSKIAPPFYEASDAHNVQQESSMAPYEQVQKLPSVVFVSFADLRLIETNSRNQALRCIDNKIVEDLASDFGRHGIDPIRLGLLMLTVRSSDYRSKWLREVRSSDELERLRIWNLHPEIKSKMNMVHLLLSELVPPESLDRINFTDGRHRLLAVYKFATEKGLMSKEKVGDSFFAVRLMLDYSDLDSRILSLQLSRDTVMNIQCITDVMNCMPVPGTEFISLKPYLRDTNNARKLLLPDLPSLRRTLALSFGLFPQSKLLMERYRTTKLFMPLSLSRKSNCVHQLVLATAQHRLLSSRNSAWVQYFSNTTSQAKAQCQLLVISASIALKIVGRCMNEKEMVSRISKAYLEALDKTVSLSRLNEAEMELFLLSTAITVLKGSLTRFSTAIPVFDVFASMKKVLTETLSLKSFFRRKHLSYETILSFKVLSRHKKRLALRVNPVVEGEEKYRPSNEPTHGAKSSSGDEVMPEEKIESLATGSPKLLTRNEVLSAPACQIPTTKAQKSEQFQSGHRNESSEEQAAVSLEDDFGPKPKFETVNVSDDESEGNKVVQHDGQSDMSEPVIESSVVIGRNQCKQVSPDQNEELSGTSKKFVTDYATPTSCNHAEIQTQHEQNETGASFPDRGMTKGTTGADFALDVRKHSPEECPKANSEVVDKGLDVSQDEGVGDRGHVGSENEKKTENELKRPTSSIPGQKLSKEGTAANVQNVGEVQKGVGVKISRPKEEYSRTTEKQINETLGIETGLSPEAVAEETKDNIIELSGYKSPNTSAIPSKDVDKNEKNGMSTILSVETATNRRSETLHGNDSEAIERAYISPPRLSTKEREQKRQSAEGAVTLVVSLDQNKSNDFKQKQIQVSCSQVRTRSGSGRKLAEVSSKAPIDAMTVKPISSKPHRARRKRRRQQVTPLNYKRARTSGEEVVLTETKKAITAEKEGQQDTYRAHCMYKCWKEAEVLTDWFRILFVRNERSEKIFYSYPPAVSEPKIAVLDSTKFWKEESTSFDALKEFGEQNLWFHQILLFQKWEEQPEDVLCFHDKTYILQHIFLRTEDQWYICGDPKDIHDCAFLYVDGNSLERREGKQYDCTVWTDIGHDIFIIQMLKKSLLNQCCFFDFTCGTESMLEVVCSDIDLSHRCRYFYRAMPRNHCVDYRKSYDLLRSICLRNCDCGGHDILDNNPSAFNQITDENLLKMNMFCAKVKSSEVTESFGLVSHASLLLRKVKGGSSPERGSLDSDLCSQRNDKNGAPIEMGAFLREEDERRILTEGNSAVITVVHPRGDYVDWKSALKDRYSFTSPFDMKQFFVSGITSIHLWFFMNNDDIGSLVNTSSDVRHHTVKLLDNYQVFDDFRLLSRMRFGALLNRETSFLKIGLDVQQLRKLNLIDKDLHRCSICRSRELFCSYGNEYILD